MQPYIRDPPKFDDLCCGFLQIEPFVSLNSLSQQQKWVIFLILEEKLTREQILQKWEQHFQRKLSSQALTNCIKRISLSQYWIQSMTAGNNYYLNLEDMKILADEVLENARLNHAYDTTSILYAARDIKKNRIKLARTALTIMRAYGMAEDLSEEIEIPCRSWVNTILAKIESKAFYPVFIDNKRFLSCTIQIIQDYFTKFSLLFNSTPRELFFTADESMVDITNFKKKIIPKNMPIYLQEEIEKFPHITGMFCTNLVGAKPPVFIILKGLKHCPEELVSFVRCGFFWLASTSTGWMDRFTFIMWSILFVGWLCQFRCGFPHYMNQPALLLLDGHTSRENPLALELLASNNVNVVILPAHTTHILQLFDIMLASPLKSELSSLLQKRMRDDSNFTDRNHAADVRRLCISSLIEAWNKVCTPTNCITGARKAGLYPVSSAEPLKSKYVRELTTVEQDIVNRRTIANTNRLNINNSLLNTRIEEIRNKLSTSGTCRFACKHLNEFQNFLDLVRVSFRTASATSVLLGAVQNFGSFYYNNCF